MRLNTLEFYLRKLAELMTEGLPQIEKQGLPYRNYNRNLRTFPHRIFRIEMTSFMFLLQQRRSSNFLFVIFVMLCFMYFSCKVVCFASDSYLVYYSLVYLCFLLESFISNVRLYLLFQKNFNQSESPMDSISAENYSLLSLLSDKETMFNSVVGHVPLVCYQVEYLIFLLSFNQ